MGIWKNIQARGLKDITDWKVIKSYLNWLWIKWFGYNVKGSEVIGFAEQITYRTLRCKPCMDAGECLICHCNTVAKISSPTSSCSDWKWEEIMTTEQWQEYKKEHKITIILL